MQFSFQRPSATFWRPYDRFHGIQQLSPCPVRLSERNVVPRRTMLMSLQVHNCVSSTVHGTMKDHASGSRSHSGNHARTDSLDGRASRQTKKKEEGRPHSIVTASNGMNIRHDAAVCPENWWTFARAPGCKGTQTWCSKRKKHGLHERRAVHAPVASVDVPEAQSGAVMRSSTGAVCAKLQAPRLVRKHQLERSMRSCETIKKQLYKNDTHQQPQTLPK